MGLVEVGVGVMPGWGGCKEMLVRNQPGPKDPKGPMPPIGAAFETISLAKVAKSAAEAKELKFLRPTDGITMNRDRLLADAKARALKMLADGYQPPKPAELRLPGPSGRTGARSGGATASRCRARRCRTMSWCPTRWPRCSAAATPTSPRS